MHPATRALLRAAANGDLHLVRALLAQGADVNSSNQAGQTPLMLAAAFRRTAIIPLLLKAGARVNDQDELGLTAFDWATDSLETIEQLKTPTKSDERIEVEPAKPASPVVVAPPPRVSEKNELTGLAAAILRDHKVRTPHPVADEVVPLSVEEVDSVVIEQPEVDSPPALAPEVELEPPPVESQPIETKLEEGLSVEEAEESGDDTLDQPNSTLSDDTIATARRHQSRIFDLETPSPRPLSKVDVPVPFYQATHSSRSGVIVWALVFLVLAAGGYGGYRLASSLLANRGTTTVAATPPSTVVQPAPVITKRAPLVGGEVVGAELHLPDAEYPINESQVKDGTVTVQVRVSKKGIVVGAKAVDGDDSLKIAAEDAARKSAFSPEKLADKPQLMDGTITYHFLSPALDTRKPSESSSEADLKSVEVSTGGPLAGTELELIEPKSPSKPLDGKKTVTVVIRVSRKGNVISWRPLEGDQKLRNAAVTAARRSTFDPEKLPGSGDVVGTITYVFR